MKEYRLTCNSTIVPDSWNNYRQEGGEIIVVERKNGYRLHPSLKFTSLEDKNILKVYVEFSPCCWEHYNNTVDNFDKIRPLLNFDDEGDTYYFVQLLIRKKQHRHLGSNSRCIKTYYIKSLEHFDLVEPEIKKLCEVFKARAGINLNRRSFKRSALQHLKKCTDQILNEDYRNAYRAFQSVAGTHKAETDKRWIVDVDVKDDGYVDKVWALIESLQPTNKTKEITTLRTVNGYHLISRPFNLKDFKAIYDVDVHKNNPTALYYYV